MKLVTLFCTETRQPTAFARQPGDIPDVISVTNAVRQLDVFGLDHPLIILDAGYYSEENVFTLMKENTKFLMRGQLDAKWVLPEYERCKKDLELPSHAVPGHQDIYGAMVSIMHEFHWTRKRARGESAKGEIVKESHRVYLYFFRDVEREKIKKGEFLRNIQQVKEQMENGVEQECMDISHNSKHTYLSPKLHPYRWKFFKPIYPFSFSRPSRFFIFPFSPVSSRRRWKTRK